MYKEWMICIVLISCIVIGNIGIQHTLNQSVEGMEERLTHMKETMLEALKSQENEQEGIEKQIEETRTYWETQYKKLSYFVEHDELEKVKTRVIPIRWEHCSRRL